jgi:hypothetical protein
MQYLLEEQGVSMDESDISGRKVWRELWDHCRSVSAAELSSLLKDTAMLEDAPADFIASCRLLP